MTGGWQLAVWLCAAAAALGAMVFAYLEFEIHLLRTSVQHVPGGLLFKCRLFQCELARASRECMVRTLHSQRAHHGDAGAAPVAHAAPFKLTLPAAGLAMALVPLTADNADPAVPPRWYTLEFRASDVLERQAQGLSGEHVQTLRLERIAAPIALDFQDFIAQARVSIDKMGAGLKDQIQVLERKAEEEALAQQKALEQAEKKALLAVPALPNDPKERIATQIAQWRASAGFAGTTSEVGADAQGNIEWFVDMDLRGRITLYANRRLYHGTLKGAGIRSLGGEVELSVREADWSELEPQMRTFAILKGATPDTRRAWSERMTMVRESLGG